MLASAAGKFKDQHIYATGGNDNTVGIWDLTDVSLTASEKPPINNGKYIGLLDKVCLLTCG